MIYFIEAVGADLVKIGFTDRNPNERLKELQTSCPYKLRLASWLDGTAETEREYHRQFQHLREQGEWFRKDMELAATMALAFMLQPILDKLGLLKGIDSTLSENISSNRDAVRDLEQRVGSMEPVVLEHTQWLVDHEERFGVYGTNCTRAIALAASAIGTLELIDANSESGFDSFATSGVNAAFNGA